MVDPVALGHELCAHRDRVGLEVVAEREVAEHLEERLVSGVATDDLDVVGAHHLLNGHGPRILGIGLPEEDRDELVHPRVREQQPRLGRRDQRRAGDALVFALLEERQEQLADAIPLHEPSLPTGLS